MKEGKTRVERAIEVVEIMRKLTELGLSVEYPGIKEFRDRALRFVSDGISWTDKIKINGTKRVLVAVITNRKGVDSSITLEYNEGV